MVVFLMCLFLIVSLGVAVALHHIAVTLLIPAYLKTYRAKKIRAGLSLAIRQLYVDIFDEARILLATMCELEGDEPYQPYMDSPLRTCPPCEFLQMSPQEQENDESIMVSITVNGVRGGRGRGRRGIARRRVIQQEQQLQVPEERPVTPPPNARARRPARLILPRFE